MKNAGLVDRPYSKWLRRLHLVLLLSVTMLLLSGAAFYFRRDLGLAQFKLEIMLAHAIIGYVMIVLLLLRLALFVIGHEQERFRHVLVRPRDLQQMIKQLGRGGLRFKFAGRSPMSRLVATSLYLLLTANALTGMVFATTVLYLPPFGGALIDYLAIDGGTATVEAIRAGEFDQARMKAVRDFKRPFGDLHVMGAISIGVLAVFHVIGVILSEWSAPSNKSARGRARIMLFGLEANK